MRGYQEDTQETFAPQTVDGHGAPGMAHRGGLQVLDK